jgi:hypothetical protein
MNTNASSAPLQHWATFNTSLFERTPHIFALRRSFCTQARAPECKNVWGGKSRSWVQIAWVEEARVSSILIKWSWLNSLSLPLALARSLARSLALSLSKEIETEEKKEYPG